MTRTACPRTAPHGWFGCVTVVLCVAGRKCRKRRHGDGTLRSLRNELQGRRDCSLADKAQPHALVASLKDSLGDGSGAGWCQDLKSCFNARFGIAYGKSLRP